jgi:hypothetical protein
VRSRERLIFGSQPIHFEPRVLKGIKEQEKEEKNRKKERALTKDKEGTLFYREKTTIILSTIRSLHNTSLLC